jgi:tetratricopeptide (TPR) repeat protein
MSEFERIVVTAPQDEPTALNAALKLLVHKAKVGASVKELVNWRARTERILETVVARAEEFSRNLLLSRFHRAASFLPQCYGNRAEVVRSMDLAERYALAMVPTDDRQKLLFLENLHPVMESRTKEALWLGDLDLALSRALRVVDIDPYDSKTWLELGQVRLRRNESLQAAEAYAMAAILGPPASAIARHMAGHCFRDLGQPMLAAFLFASALEVDPRAISPHDQIQALPDLPALAVLKEWGLRSFEF